MDNIKISLYIEKKRELLLKISDSIWEYAETGYNEHRSSELLCDVLASEGFEVEKGSADIETAFTASFGSGKPVIGFLGEYDSQRGMSQIAGIAEKAPIEQGGNGHACGHHLIGAGALAAALAVKNYIKENGIKGTVKYFGCPAAESGCGKVYMARSGCFGGLDAAITWHPFTSSNIMTFNVLATVGAYFKFHGVSSHASGSPHLGRSALDAVGLMNVGTNFLREHVESDVRIHYAITESGGLSPNVVQREAAVLYQIRATKLSQVREVYERVVNIAKGAALMTGTKMEVIFDKASSNMLHNQVLGALLHRKFKEIGTVTVDGGDIDFAVRIRKTLNEKEKRLDEAIAVGMFGETGKNMLGHISGKEIIDAIYPYDPSDIVSMGSNDLADVSWNTPTVCFHVTAFAKDTPPHSWQQVAQGKSKLSHNAVLHAGKVMATAAAELLENPELLVKAREELNRKRGSEEYICPIPPDVIPSALR